MKKNSVNGRVFFLRAWNRHLYSISREQNIARKRKTGHKKIVISNDAGFISNPIVNFIDKIVPMKKGISGKIISKNKIIVPRKLSFYENPEESLIFIHSASKFISRGTNKSVTIDYTSAQYKCLGAEYLLGLAVTEARQSNVNFSDKVIINGTYPKKEAHREIIKCMGIVKEMDEASPGTILDYTTRKDNPKQRVFKFDSIGKEEASAFAQDRKNHTAEKFAQYIDECLNDHDLQLKENASKYLTSCMGELLDNAERHCGLSQRPRWFVRGYVNNNAHSPVCELTIINFGNTIAETFEGLPETHFSFNEQVKPYVKKHINKRGMFREGLVTVAALQGRVSCKNITDSDSSGTGTIELLKFFQDMHDNLRRIRGSSIEEPKMSLISGKTHISFDGRYRLICKIDEEDDESETYSYPFNNDSLATEPDRAYLKEMTNAYFPGVMVNIRFPLQKTKRS
ncbi:MULTISPECIES: hypothetical protein [Enterobacteriaceae]|uniref:hypothetical protein n=1 Tax=Enterobacteriaceae TaxID=543 RepID=UPI000E2DC872|nr:MULTISPECIES: hypothetical protein [Enterobacteriaceae]QNK09433.1 hypothetical protein HF679_08360 [Enterobacter sp. JUb54]SVJ85883.1 Uncharacterised protein [Klebsiella pneumoniae]HCI4342488.1 hypothetical protein [Klebsiella pneumoniae]HDT6089406.1 hypothetical protein [Raoultella ornithinolytica]